MLARLKEETTTAQASLLNFVKEAATWKEILGEEAYEERKTRLIAKEATCRAKFESKEDQLCKTHEELEKLLASTTV